MSKEKTETKDLVALEMTKDEAKEFAAFKAQKEKEEKERIDGPDPAQLFHMDLAYRHNIGGKRLGPGPTQVPRYLVGKIQHHEQAQLMNEIRLNQSATNFFKVSLQGAVTKVTEMPV